MPNTPQNNSDQQIGGYILPPEIAESIERALARQDRGSAASGATSGQLWYQNGRVVMRPRQQETQIAPPDVRVQQEMPDLLDVSEDPVRTTPRSTQGILSAHWTQETQPIEIDTDGWWNEMAATPRRSAHVDATRTPDGVWQVTPRTPQDRSQIRTYGQLQAANGHIPERSSAPMLLFGHWQSSMLSANELVTIREKGVRPGVVPMQLVGKIPRKRGSQYYPQRPTHYYSIPLIGHSLRRESRSSQIQHWLVVRYELIYVRFKEGQVIDLPPAEAIEYALSCETVDSVYCSAFLTYAEAFREMERANHRQLLESRTVFGSNSNRRQGYYMLRRVYDYQRLTPWHRHDAMRHKTETYVVGQSRWAVEVCQECYRKFYVPMDMIEESEGHVPKECTGDLETVALTQMIQQAGPRYVEPPSFTQRAEVQEYQTMFQQERMVLDEA